MRTRPWQVSGSGPGLLIELDGEEVEGVEDGVGGDGCQQIGRLSVEPGEQEGQQDQRREGGGVGVHEGEEQRGADPCQARMARVVQGAEEQAAEEGFLGRRCQDEGHHGQAELPAPICGFLEDLHGHLDVRGEVQVLEHGHAQQLKSPGGGQDRARGGEAQQEGASGPYAQAEGVAPGGAMLVEKPCDEDQGGTLETQPGPQDLPVPGRSFGGPGPLVCHAQADQPQIERDGEPDELAAKPFPGPLLKGEGERGDQAEQTGYGQPENPRGDGAGAFAGEQAGPGSDHDTGQHSREQADECLSGPWTGAVHFIVLPAGAPPGLAESVGIPLSWALQLVRERPSHVPPAGHPVGFMAVPEHGHPAAVDAGRFFRGPHTARTEAPSGPHGNLGDSRGADEPK